MTFEAMTIARLASLVGESHDVEHRRLYFAAFLEEYQQEPAAVRGRLLADEPGHTGLAEWDALLAGLAEHLSSADRASPPAWVDREARFLADPWCYFDLPFFRAEAERDAPEGFTRHGVLIRAVVLERV